SLVADWQRSRTARTAGARSADASARSVRLRPPVGRRIGTVSSLEAHSSRIAASRPRDLAYAPAGVVWASIVRPSAPSVIGTLRGFADSATGIRNVSTPVS